MSLILMLIIGLTGGIGAGKSTVAQLFADRGIPIIDADVIAHHLTEPRTPSFHAIIEHFGSILLKKDGLLDRTQLRALIFKNPDERSWLEQLLHPLIREEIKTQIQALSAPYCLIVIPLLVEAESFPFINRIIVVDTLPKNQIKRVIERDQINKSQIEAILKTQASREDRLTKAHDILINDGRREDLIPQVEKLHQQYLKLKKST